MGLGCEVFCDDGFGPRAELRSMAFAGGVPFEAIIRRSRCVLVKFPDSSATPLARASEGLLSSQGF